MKRIFSRRNILKLGAGALGTGVVTAGVGSQLVSPPKVIAENNISPDQALKELIDGNERFVKRKQKSVITIHV